MDKWWAVCRKLPDEDLINLYKGLIEMEKILHWPGGSVAAAIWVWKEMVLGRKLDEDRSLTLRGLSCSNSYIPFGSSTFRARSWEEYDAQVEEASRKYAERQARYLAIDPAIVGRKFRRKAAIAELRSLGIAERKQIQEALRLKYADATLLERITMVAADTRYPPEYYPTEWAFLEKEEIAALPPETAKSLIDKLACRSRGPWNALLQGILSRGDEGTDPRRYSLPPV
jgi:hypothetical protein